MRHRTVLLSLALVSGATAVAAQSPEPKAAFVQAVGQFSLALDGAYGDEGTRVRSSLDAMSRALDEWDALLRKYEAAMAADLRTAAPALATKMHLALGGLYLDRIRTADGLRELAAAGKLDQARADVPIFEALAHSQLEGNDPAATAALRRASTLSPNDAMTAYVLARHLSRTGASEEAIRAYDSFVSTETRRPAQNQAPSAAPFVDLRLVHERPGVEPFFPPALYADGFAELQRGNLPRAIELFRQGAARDPLVAENGVESGALERAATALRDGSLERATGHIAVAIELAPDRAEPHRILGLIHLANREPDAAAKALNAAITLNPRDERARLALADALIAGDSLPAAREALQELLKLYPSSGRARYKLGLVYQRQGLYADAIRELTAAAALKPLIGLNSVYQTIGALARSQQQYDVATTAFSQRVDLIPNDAGAHHDLGDMYFRQGRQSEALAEFTAAVMLDPKRVDSHAAIGQVQLRGGNYGEAVTAARRAVALDDSHREARYVLATSLVRMGNVDEGKRELEVYQRLQSDATAARSRQLEIEGLRRDASVSIVNGEFAKAVGLLRQALERDANSAQSHLDLGLALLKAGQPAEAVEHLTAAAARENTEDAHAYLSDAYAALGRRADAERERAIVGTDATGRAASRRCWTLRYLKSRSRRTGPTIVGLALAWFTAAQLTTSQTPASVQFVNASTQSGIDFQHVNGASPDRHLYEIMSGGGLFFDYDNDGWLDVFLVDGGSLINAATNKTARHRLYRNRGNGTFQDVSASSGITHNGYGMGACAADVNNDGWIDLYVTSVGVNALYQNNGESLPRRSLAKAGHLPTSQRHRAWAARRPSAPAARLPTSTATATSISSSSTTSMPASTTTSSAATSAASTASTAIR